MDHWRPIGRLPALEGMVPCIHHFRNESKKNGLTLTCSGGRGPPKDVLLKRVLLDPCSNAQIISMDVVRQVWGDDPPIVWQSTSVHGATGENMKFAGTILASYITPRLKIGTSAHIALAGDGPWLVSPGCPGPTRC